MLDRLLALALVRQRGADLAVQLGHMLEVLPVGEVRQAALPGLDRRLHAAEAQLDVAALLGDAQQHRVVAVGERFGRLVVHERFAVGEEGARTVARCLAEGERFGTELGELVRLQAHVGGERRGKPVVLGQQPHDTLAAFAGALLDEGADLGVLARPHRLGQRLVGYVAD